MLKKRYFSAEFLTLVYSLVTIVYMMLFFSRVDHPALFFGIRLGAIASISFLAIASERYPSELLKNIRQFLPFILLGYWYSETFFFSEMFTLNKDEFFCGLDQQLTGCQPSILFSQLFPQAWFSELMYFGYFSHYLFMFGIPLWFWFKHPQLFDRVVFIMVCTMFLYYSVYDLLPVAGPQFYFKGADAMVPKGYVFCWLVHFIQWIGEYPTGAFPSSHVGMTIVVLILTCRYDRRLFWCILPVACLLICSTVYIKAHYFVDVLGGILSAILLYGVSGALFDLLAERKILLISFSKKDSGKEY
ncbi:MAG: phosphatase PAP2 family protein [Bacteroidota bacterium]|nr:phosphatase PAP2 family protein [Bacteroidota bacterium]